MAQVPFFHMEKGKKYEVRYRIKGVQHYDRKSVMVYLGVRDSYVEYEFSARPVAGTQRIRFDNVISVKQVSDNTQCFVDARWKA